MAARGFFAPGPHPLELVIGSNRTYALKGKKLETDPYVTSQSDGITWTITNSTGQSGPFVISIGNFRCLGRPAASPVQIDPDASTCVTPGLQATGTTCALVAQPLSGQTCTAGGSGTVHKWKFDFRLTTGERTTTIDPELQIEGGDRVKVVAFIVGAGALLALAAWQLLRDKTASANA
jgi:hypothetical protein